jgi:hypothetical protein
VNVSEPSMTSREGAPADGLFQRGRRDWPQESGGCRPEGNRRPGAHHRPRDKGGALPGRSLLMCNTTTPLGSGHWVAGRPTVRKAQFPCGRRMTQEANAGSRKAAGNRGPLDRLLRRMDFG